MAYSLTGFRRYVEKLKDEEGRPLELEAFQAKALTEHFSGVKETVIVIPEENGKTTILAALALYHLEAWPGPDPFVPLFAAARDQAGILFEQAAGLVERSDLEETFQVKRGYRIIRLAENRRARIMVKASDERTSDGVIPTLVLIDEYHRHRTDGAYSIARHKLGKRNGRMVTITTAGSEPKSPLGHLRETVHKMEGFTRRGVYNRIVTEDFAWHEWCLEPDANLDDLKLVKKANPASFVTLDYLKSKRSSPAHDPGRWARFVCGVWTEGEDPWLDPKAWDRLAVDITGVEDGEDVHLDVSAGSRSGIAIVARREDGVAVLGEVLPEGPLQVVEARLLELAEKYRVIDCGYDRVEFQRSADLLTEKGLNMLEVPHSPERLAIASTTLRELINGGKLRHDGDPVLREQVLAGRTKESERGWRLVKTADNRALIALALACHRATQNHVSEPMVAYR